MAKRTSTERSGQTAAIFVDIEGTAQTAPVGQGRLWECWGCGQQLQQLSNDDQRCSSCGALNARIVETEPTVADVLMTLISQPTIRRIWSFVMVLFVTGVIQSITITGVVYIYPNFLPQSSASFYFHWLLCFCLWANTTLNYAEAVLRDPGFVEWNSGSPEGCSFCHRCQQGKPFDSHHCRICRRCVQNMDHHCPFIGNCVGKSNRRAFVLFLFWSASSLAYVLTITALHCWDRSEDIVRNVREATAVLPPLTLDTLPFYLHRVINHTYVGVHLHAAGFLLLLGSVTFFMTFSLLVQQARLICDGQTTIGRLQAKRSAREKQEKGLEEYQADIQVKSANTWLQNWQDVFGTGPWFSFLLPSIPWSSHSGPAKTV